MCSSIGINAGFLWNIDNHHVYFTDHRSEVNPFTNPMMNDIFKMAAAVIINELEPSENNTYIVREKFITILKENFSLEQIHHLTHVFSLETNRSEVSPEIKKLLFSSDPYEIFIGHLFCLPQFSSKPAENLLVVRAKAEGKKLVRLFNDAIENTVADLDLQRMGALLKGPLSPQIQLFADNKFGNDLVDSKSSSVKAWEHGSLQFYPDGGPTKIFAEKMSQIPSNSFIKNTLENSLVEAEIITQNHLKQVANKMDELMQNSQNLLFVLPAQDYCPSLLELLQGKGKTVAGPLKTDIKPVGLFWEIISPLGKKGYLLGSIHRTHACLNSFNSKIWKYYNEAKVLAVEADITRNEHLELSNLFKEKISKAQQAEIEKLSAEERNIVLAKLQLVDQEYMDGKVDQKRDLLGQLQKIYVACDDKFEVTESMDSTFVKIAEKQGKPIEDLEKAKDRYGIFEPDPHSFITTSYETLLSWTHSHVTHQMIYNEIQQQAVTQIIFNAEMWGQGNLELLERVIGHSLSPEEKQKDIMRNLQMALRIDELVKTDRQPFAVAGSSHMAGEFSILHYLKGFGYKVNRIIHEESIN